MPPEQEPPPQHRHPSPHPDRPGIGPQPEVPAEHRIEDNLPAEDRLEDGPDADSLLAENRRKTRRLIRIRLCLLGISAAGVLAAAAFWIAGHAGVALRVLAGDLLMILFALLLF